MSLHGHREIELTIDGLGILLFSPYAVAGIEEGEDYLSQYSDETQVQEHIQKGDLVGFGTGSPGRFRLCLFEGYPAEERLARATYKLRLGLVVRGGEVHFRDLYDLMDWVPQTPKAQVVGVDDGTYHVTLCSEPPNSGQIGDNQVIEVYFAPLNEFPSLSMRGVPMLVP